MSVESRFVPVDLSGRRAAVAGAGIAGLATALALAERGAEVVMLEPDPAPPALDVEEAFARWSRRRTPQSRHSHAFLARLRTILLRAYPDVYRALLENGARELRLLDFPPRALAPLAPEPGDEDLAAIGCRRTTFEWVLRRAVEALPGVRLLSGASVAGLIASPRRRVRGVRFIDEGGRRRTLRADLVIDASGRRSRAPEWLEDLGAPTPFEERSSSAILYYTRFYRLRPGKELPAPGDQPNMADFGWIKFAVFPADRSTYSVTFAAHLAEPRLKALAHAGAFELLLGLFPGLAPFGDPEVAEPLPVHGREVLSMGGLENCLRRFVDEAGRPLAPGFFAIGDAAYHTNPLYGRGSTQAFMHAALLGEALDAAAGDVEVAARRLDHDAREEIEPFYRSSVAADRMASQKAGALPAALGERVLRSFFDDGVLPATRIDAVVFRAFVRMFNMFDTPERAFFRPEVFWRVVGVWLRGPAFRRRMAFVEPDREEAIRACERAARAFAKPLRPRPATPAAADGAG